MPIMPEGHFVLIDDLRSKVSHHASMAAAYDKLNAQDYADKERGKADELRKHVAAFEEKHLA